MHCRAVLILYNHDEDRPHGAYGMAFQDVRYVPPSQCEAMAHEAICNDVQAMINHFENRPPPVRLAGYDCGRVNPDRLALVRHITHDYLATHR